MKVFPVINCESFDCVKNRIDTILNFGDQYLDKIHIDVSDGIFSSSKTWNSPFELKKLLEDRSLDLKFAVHLMTEHPILHLHNWISADLIKKAIVPVSTQDSLTDFSKICRDNNITPVLSIAMEDSVDDFIKWQEDYLNVQILAVNAGPSGQTFQSEALERITFLRKQYPQVILEVDGGINVEIGLKLKEMGISAVSISSYIFNSPNPEFAYQELVRNLR